MAGENVSYKIKMHGLQIRAIKVFIKKISMRIIVIVLATISLLSCNKESDCKPIIKELVFKNHNFEKVFKASFKQLEMDMIETDKNTILEFKIDPYYNYDTIITIKNCPPHSVQNLVSVKSYNNSKVYIYSTKDLLEKLNEFVEVNDDTLNYVKIKPLPYSYECIYTKRSKLVNNKFTTVIDKIQYLLAGARVTLMTTKLWL